MAGDITRLDFQFQPRIPGRRAREKEFTMRQVKIQEEKGQEAEEEENVHQECRN